MDARFSRAAIAKRTDPHRWQTFEQYRIVHDARLEEHPFIDRSKPDTLVFEEIEDRGVVVIHLYGEVYCRGSVVLEVEKWFETRVTSGRVQVRGVRYRYIGYTRSKGLLLKYHNVHEDPNEYIHRIYDPVTGEEQSEQLSRTQFPVFTEVLDELALLMDLSNT